jgi:hypothetical protein
MPVASGDEVLRCAQDDRDSYFFSSNLSAAPFMQ